MSYLQAKRQKVLERNVAMLQHFKDHVGDDRAILLGTKTLKSSSFDNCVWASYPYRLLAALIAKNGSGKSVHVSAIAEQAHYANGWPLIIEDVKREVASRKEPLSSPQSAVMRLENLGFHPLGLENLRVVSPKFAEFKADIQAGVSLQRTMQCSKWLANHLVSSYLAGNDELSGSGSAAVAFVFDKLKALPKGASYSPTVLRTFYDDYARALSQEARAGSAVGSTIARNLFMLLRSDFFVGENLELENWLNEKNAEMAIESSIHVDRSELSSLMSLFNLYVHSLVWELRRENKIPRSISIIEEARSKLDGREREIILRSVMQERSEGNSAVYVFQQIDERAREFLNQMDFLLVNRVTDANALDYFSQKTNARNIGDLTALSQDSKPHEFALVTDDSILTYFPLPSWSQFEVRT